MELMKGMKALSNPTRLRILKLLKNPPLHAASKTEDGVVRRGVTARVLLSHLRCRPSSLSEQMDILSSVGLVEGRRVGRTVLYTRDEERIKQLKQTIIDELLP